MVRLYPLAICYVQLKRNSASVCIINNVLIKQQLLNVDVENLLKFRLDIYLAAKTGFKWNSLKLSQSRF